MIEFAYDDPYPENMDVECIKLCNYLNSLPGIVTSESCCGHGKSPFSIWLHVNDLMGVSFLGRCLDRRYCGHDPDIKLEVSNSDTNENFAVMHLYTPNHKGTEAYQLIDDLCKNMDEHLNHKNYMKAFMDIKAFNIKEI